MNSEHTILQVQDLCVDAVDRHGNSVEELAIEVDGDAALLAGVERDDDHAIIVDEGCRNGAVTSVT